MKTIFSTCPAVLCLFFCLNVSAGSIQPRRQEIFALVVANNRSLQSHRPNLHYADDDGARYTQMFRSVAPSENVILLTRLDPETKKLYPKLGAQARPPTRKQVARAMDLLRRKMKKAKESGRNVSFYFVFAGHGHVQHGKGYMELEDGRIGPSELEQTILKDTKADVVHLLLDSCNSFFVIGPRKPGGRRWATPKDLTRSFSKRYPNVGVFLSTSSSGEVYEWSEVQSGIFSHEVRSGLTGAADANRDGKISYDELAAFVSVSNRSIKNSHFRPKVVSRGPYSRGNATLFAYRHARGRKIKLDKRARRLWIRDAQGSRLADLHKEEGFELELTIPRPLHEKLFVQELRSPRTNDKGTRPSLLQYTIAPARQTPARKALEPAKHAPPEPAGNPRKEPTPSESNPVILASLAPGPAPAAARGQDTVFIQIFTDPYGPKAYGEYLKTRDRAAQPYLGISWQDKIRMHHYLEQLAKLDRQTRFLKGAAVTFMGSMLVSLGSIAIYDIEKGKSSESSSRMDRWLLGAMIGTGSLLVGFGIYSLLHRSQGERAYDAFLKELANPNATFESVLARTERHMQAIARRERTTRIVTGTMGIIGGGILAVASAWEAVSYKRSEPRDRSHITSSVTLGIASVSLLGFGCASYLIKSPIERMLLLYRKDPDLNLRFGAAPLPGGLSLSFSGRF